MIRVPRPCLDPNLVPYCRLFFFTCTTILCKYKQLCETSTTPLHFNQAASQGASGGKLRCAERKELPLVCESGTVLASNSFCVRWANVPSNVVPKPPTPQRPKGKRVSKGSSFTEKVYFWTARQRRQQLSTKKNEKGKLESHLKSVSFWGRCEGAPADR